MQEGDCDPQPLVSIGVPTYNRPEGLRRALQSLVGQTYQNLQIVISDNASSDPRSEETAREFAQSDRRIEYVRQETNNGYISNFQFVLSKARGSYFFWAADDDMHSPDFVSELISALNKNPASLLAFCDMAQVSSDGTRQPNSIYKTLVAICRPNKLIRLGQYFLRENGKTHLMYGIVRTKALEGIDLSAINAEAGGHAFDAILVYRLLQLGQVALVDKLMFFSTVGNAKSHNASFVSKSIAQSVKNIVRNYANNVRMIAVYFRASDRDAKIVVAFLAATKFLLITYLMLLSSASGLFRILRRGVSL